MNLMGWRICLPDLVCGWGVLAGALSVAVSRLVCVFRAPVSRGWRWLLHHYPLGSEYRLYGPWRKMWLLWEGPVVLVALTTWLPRFPMVKGSTVDMNRDSHTCVPFYWIVGGSNDNCLVDPDYESGNSQSVDCHSAMVGSSWRIVTGPWGSGFVMLATGYFCKLWAVRCQQERIGRGLRLGHWGYDGCDIHYPASQLG